MNREELLRAIDNARHEDLSDLALAVAKEQHRQAVKEASVVVLCNNTTAHVIDTTLALIEKLEGTCPARVVINGRMRHGEALIFNPFSPEGAYYTRNTGEIFEQLGKLR